MADPLVTVLMPVRNEEAFLHRSLGAVMAQDYPNLEILVVDGASTDHTVEIVKELQQQDPRIRLLHNPGQWQARALNIGQQASKGEIIARVDGHTIIAPDYIRQCVDLLHHYADVVSVGGTQKAVGRSLLGKAVALSYHSRFGVPSILRHATEDTYAFGAYMGVWRRHILEKVGGWREDYRVQEDFEHYYRIGLAGGKTIISPRVKSEYYCRDTWQALLTQYYRYGRGKVKTLRDHPESLRWRHTVAPLFVSAILIGAVLGYFIPLVFYLWLALISLYMSINIAVSFIQSQGKWGLFWRLMLVYVIIHFVWGIGFWVEIFNLKRLSQ